MGEGTAERNMRRKVEAELIKVLAALDDAIRTGNIAIREDGQLHICTAVLRRREAPALWAYLRQAEKRAQSGTQGAGQ